MFTEISSTTRVADSNKVAPSIKCTIYGDIFYDAKKIKRGVITKSKDPNSSATLAALTVKEPCYDCLCGVHTRV